jgi:hypothetical protein
LLQALKYVPAVVVDGSSDGGAVDGAGAKVIAHGKNCGGARG